MNDIAEFLPIKLTPGFIALTFHLGCVGCNFCSVRYGNSRDLVFSAAIQRQYPTGPDDIVRMLTGMPSFSKARVPLRLGNDTDLRFELSQSIKVLDLIPHDYPVAVLTRFPVTEAEAKQLGRRNVIVKLTATPTSAQLDCPKNAEEVIESVGLFDTPVVLALGPLTADNFDDALQLLRRVPRRPNVSVYVKPLNDEFHASLRQISKISTDQYLAIRRAVDDTGLRHLSQLMCSVNDQLRIRHKRVCDVPYDEQAYCLPCSAHALCYEADDLLRNRLSDELAGLGLSERGTPHRVGFKNYAIQVDSPTGFGDEAYLSEVLGCKVKLSGTNIGTGGGSFAASRQVLERWDRVGFFPYSELLWKVQPFIEESFRAAKSRIKRID